MKIDPQNNMIIFTLSESSKAASEIGRTISISGTNLKILTVETGDKFEVTISRSYSGLDIVYDKTDTNDGNTNHILSQAATPYRLIVQNQGGDPDVINIYDVS
ncbi:hypothetical protein IID20_04140 [Patescibacteria group bacterium]|nr:hypothetical protein [Patescibacteria group bacterium]